MNTVQLLRNKTIANCKSICKYMGQNEPLYMEKFKRIVSNIERENRKNMAYMAPEDFYIKVYNRSIYWMDQFKPVEI